MMWSGKSAKMFLAKFAKMFQGRFVRMFHAKNVSPFQKRFARMSQNKNVKTNVWTSTGVKSALNLGPVAGSQGETMENKPENQNTEQAQTINFLKIPELSV